MPSTLADFSSPSRLLKTRIRVDLNNLGTFTDYTDNLDYYTIHSKTDGKISGIYETELEAELNFENPSLNWAKPGLPVEVYISVTSDNGATYHEEMLFKGTTSAQNTVPVGQVKIKATTYNSNYLDKKAARQVFINQDVNDIIESLLLEVGVPALSISLTATGTILPVYFVSDNIPIREYIEDLAKANLQLVGFDKDNIFRSSSLQKLTTSGAAIVPDVTVTLDTMLDYKAQDITSQYYANTLRVKGHRFVYLSNTQIYFNNQLQGYEILPLSELYFSLEIPDTDVVILNPLIARNRSSVGSPITTWGYQTRGYYDFFTSDDGSGNADNSQITLLSSSIAFQDGKEIVFLKFSNAHASNSYFLKSLVLNGTAVRKIADIVDTRQNPSTLASDGKEILIELESKAIQDDSIASNAINTLQINFYNYLDVYKFDVRGRPELQVGKVLNFRDRSNNDYDGVVTEIDAIISGDEGYTQTIIVKKLEYTTTYAGFDDPAYSFDNPAFSLF